MGREVYVAGGASCWAALRRLGSLCTLALKRMHAQTCESGVRVVPPAEKYGISYGIEGAGPGSLPR